MCENFIKWIPLIIALLLFEGIVVVIFVSNIFHYIAMTEQYREYKEQQRRTNDLIQQLKDSNENKQK